jgi:hypothetical protein
MRWVADKDRDELDESWLDSLDRLQAFVAARVDDRELAADITQDVIVRSIASGALERVGSSIAPINRCRLAHGCLQTRSAVCRSACRRLGAESRWTASSAAVQVAHRTRRADGSTTMMRLIVAVRVRWC